MTSERPSGRTVPAPAFARPDAEAPWRPDPGLLAEGRLARFLAASGEPDLEALQAHAVADPGWFWGAAVDALAIPWQRRPAAVLDTSDGIAFARWWRGGAFDHSRASLEPWLGTAPDAEAGWPGLTRQRLEGPVSRR